MENPRTFSAPTPYTISMFTLIQFDYFLPVLLVYEIIEDFFIETQIGCHNYAHLFSLFLIFFG